MNDHLTGAGCDYGAQKIGPGVASGQLSLVVHEAFNNMYQAGVAMARLDELENQPDQQCAEYAGPELRRQLRQALHAEYAGLLKQPAGEVDQVVQCGNRQPGQQAADAAQQGQRENARLRGDGEHHSQGRGPTPSFHPCTHANLTSFPDLEVYV